MRGVTGGIFFCCGGVAFCCGELVFLLEEDQPKKFCNEDESGIPPTIKAFTGFETPKVIATAIEMTCFFMFPSCQFLYVVKKLVTILLDHHPL